jgi:hypothetical protein
LTVSVTIRLAVFVSTGLLAHPRNFGSATPRARVMLVGHVFGDRVHHAPTRGRTIVLDKR